MRTAIFIRGHARTWNLTKRHNLMFFDDLYDNIDWYFGTIDTGTVYADGIDADFKGRNLVSRLLLDPTGYALGEDLDAVLRWQTYHTAYWRLAWIDYMLGKEKRRAERQHGMRYDNIVFIRPDVIYYRAPHTRGISDNLEEPLNHMSVAEIGTHSDVAGDVGVGDLIIRAGATAADLLTLRYIDPIYTDGFGHQLVHGNSHSLLAQYPIRRFMGWSKERSGIESYLVRPDHADLVDWSISMIDPNMRDSSTWHLSSVEQRISCCERLGISPDDYQLKT